MGEQYYIKKVDEAFMNDIPPDAQKEATVGDFVMNDKSKELEYKPKPKSKETGDDDKKNEGIKNTINGLYAQLNKTFIENKEISEDLQITTLKRVIDELENLISGQTKKHIDIEQKEVKNETDVIDTAALSFLKKLDEDDSFLKKLKNVEPRVDGVITKVLYELYKGEATLAIGAGAHFRQKLIELNNQLIKQNINDETLAEKKIIISIGSRDFEENVANIRNIINNLKKKITEEDLKKLTALIKIMFIVMDSKKHLN